MDEIVSASSKPEDNVDPAGGRESFLSVEDLTKVFTRGSGRSKQVLRAVDGVSFDVARGETLGLVGESGCGKSTVARCILRLLEPTSGTVTFDGIDVLAQQPRELRALRRRMQILFQDPGASLDPRMSVRALVEEPLVVHSIGSATERAARVRELLELVGLSAEHASRKPHAFSGGQKQRVALSRALVLDPDLLVLDEPVSALDVSIQAQILNLLRRLGNDLNLTYVFIVHDLAVAGFFCHRIAVLYRGLIVETGPRRQLFEQPLHPYTVALLSAAPEPDPTAKRRGGRIVLPGEVESTSTDQNGCRFAARCPVGHGRPICETTTPALRQMPDGHWVACHFPGELTPPGPGLSALASVVQEPS